PVSDRPPPPPPAVPQPTCTAANAESAALSARSVCCPADTPAGTVTEALNAPEASACANPSSTASDSRLSRTSAFGAKPSPNTPSVPTASTHDADTDTDAD